MIYVLRHCKATGQEFDAALTTDGIKSAFNKLQNTVNL